MDREGTMLSSQELFYCSQAEDTLHQAMCMLQQDGWQAETYQNGDWILSKTFPRTGKVFRAEAIIDSPPERIYSQLFEQLEQMDQWNPSISKVQILQKIGRNTLLTREITAQIPANMVRQRDFVSVRHCYRKGSSLYLIGTATESQLMPPQKGIIRAEAGLTCIVLQPIDGDNGKTHFTWLLSLDLKVMSGGQRSFLKKKLQVCESQKYFMFLEGFVQVEDNPFKGNLSPRKSRGRAKYACAGAVAEDQKRTSWKEDRRRRSGPETPIRPDQQRDRPWVLKGLSCLSVQVYSNCDCSLVNPHIACAVLCEDPTVLVPGAEGT
ncbi:unnamed protein product, partial [Ranitomeya imitator]